MDNWLSYMPKKYYNDSLYELFNINKCALQTDITNNKKSFYTYISEIINNINLNDKIIYDCCCNIGSYCILLSKYAKLCYGMDINSTFIEIGQYVVQNKNITNCYFINKPYFEINNKNWYYTNIKQIDIILCFSLGCKLFRENTKRIIYQVNLIYLIQHYKPYYIIFNKTKYDTYTSFNQFIKILKSLKYSLIDESLSKKENQLWIFFR